MGERGRERPLFPLFNRDGLLTGCKFLQRLQGQRSRASQQHRLLERVCSSNPNLQKSYTHAFVYIYIYKERERERERARESIFFRNLIMGSFLNSHLNIWSPFATVVPRFAKADGAPRRRLFLVSRSLQGPAPSPTPLFILVSFLYLSFCLYMFLFSQFYQII